MFDMIILTGVTSPMIMRTIGPYAIAHAVRQTGRSVQVIDYTDWFSNEELYNTVKKFIGINTKFIGVSSTFYQKRIIKSSPTSWLEKNLVLGIPDNVVKLIEKIKIEFPYIKILLGGANSQLYRNDAKFDAIFHGYSDSSIIEYIENNDKRSNDVFRGEDYPVNVQCLSHRWEANDFIMPGESLPIEISRGCIFKCKFCNFQLTGKKKFDYLRDPLLIRDELLYNYENFGTTNYTFADDTFNDSTYKLEQLYKAISTLPFKINFCTYMRIDLLYAHREQIQLAKELGLKSAFFGIESFNPITAKIIGKGMARDKVKDFLLELKYDHFKEDINFVCSFILGLPKEDIKSIEDTFNWNQKYDLNALYLPLFIRPKSEFKSDIDINYEKYGYNLSGTDMYWENEYTNYKEVSAISADYNERTNCFFHSWFLFSLASLGLMSINDLMKLRFKGNSPDDERKAQNRMVTLVTDYKRKLNGSL